MRKRIIEFTTVCATSALVLSACGSDDSPTEADVIGLTTNEVSELATELVDALELISLDFLGGSAATPAATAVPVSIDETIGAEAPCDLELGFVFVDGSVTGVVDDETGEVDLTLTATMDFDDCAVVGESATYTLNGAPDIDLSADFTAAEGDQAISVALGIVGAVSLVTDDDRSGTCSINLSGNLAIGFETSGQITGSVCGISTSALELET